MNLNPVISHLRTYCPSFGGRVSGAARYKLIDENNTLDVPAAFVIPLDDNPDARMSQNDIWQPLLDAFSVVVAVSNTVDERGHAAVNSAHDTIRSELWAALLGWQPDDLGGGSRYRGIEYQGGNLLALDRARLWYQYDFAAQMFISPADGWQNTELNNLPHFDGATIKVDDIDPAFDANLVPAGSQGPDGRIEHTVIIPKTGNLP